MVDGASNVVFYGMKTTFILCLSMLPLRGLRWVARRREGGAPHLETEIASNLYTDRTKIL